MPQKSAKSKSGKRKKISLALQGGGSLGAFTWGVLDRLLEDERIEIAAISGASAGAMNAVVLAEGHHLGGPQGARAGLREFWEGIARGGLANPYRKTSLAAFMNAFTPSWAQSVVSPWSFWADIASRVASPYELNPLNINPLQEMLDELVEFEHVRACTSIKLFVSATNVLTGRIRVFENAELSAAHVMASACLPLLFQAVEIEGAPYWDGGYMGNPALFPLFDVGDTRDIVIVQINPIERESAPRNAPDIIARINEITFNASLLRELRAVEFVTRLIDEERLPSERYRKMLIHAIGGGEPLAELGDGANLNTDWNFLEGLFEKGRETCAAWLAAQYDNLGARSALDLRALFQGESRG